MPLGAFNSDIIIVIRSVKVTKRNSGTRPCTLEDFAEAETLRCWGEDGNNDPAASTQDVTRRQDKATGTKTDGQAMNSQCDVIYAQEALTVPARLCTAPSFVVIRGG